MNIPTTTFEPPAEQIVTMRAISVFDFVLWMIPYIIAIYLYYTKKDTLDEKKLKILQWIIYLWPVFAAIMLVLQIYLFKISYVN